MDDLVKRLREYGGNRLWPHGPACDCTQAADRIEALEVKLEKAVEALSAIEGWTNNTAIEEFARITIAAVAEPHKLTSSEAAYGEAKGDNDE